MVEVMNKVNTKQSELSVNDQSLIAVIGLGYVGLPLAAELGVVRDVVGFDIDVTRINALRKGIDVTKELDEHKLSKAKHLQYAANVEAIKNAAIYIVTVPTPIDDAKQPDLRPLASACQLVGQCISPGNLVIFESTVYPGCTEEYCVPLLEKASGLKFNQDFFCGYSPERMNPGDKVKTITQITKVTSGSTPAVAQFVDQLYQSIVTVGTYLAPSIKVAEAAKVIENTQRDLNIALVNELAIIFERMGIDTLDVLKAAESKWNFLPFRPGMVGGHCIGVDPYYLTHKAESLHYHPQVILAGRRINDGMAKHIATSFIKAMVKNGIDVGKANVGVLGVTFKQNCPDIRNTKVIDLIHELKNWGITVSVADPWADEAEVKQVHGIKLSSMEAMRGLDGLVVAVAHDEYQKISAKELRAMCHNKQPVIADIKSLYDRDALLAAGFSIYRL